MCSHENITWKVVNNSVMNRMIDNSFIHKFMTAQMRKRTKIFNAELKKRNISSYKEYVHLKTILLRNVVEDYDVDIDNLSDIDYNIIYNMPSMLDHYVAKNSVKYIFTSDEDSELERKNNKHKNKSQTKCNIKKLSKPQLSEKYIDIDSQNVIKKNRDGSYIDHSISTINTNNVSNKHVNCKSLKNVRKNLISLLDEIDSTNNDKNNDKIDNNNKKNESTGNNFNLDQSFLATINNSDRSSTPLNKIQIEVQNSLPSSLLFNEQKYFTDNEDLQNNFIKNKQFNLKSPMNVLADIAEEMLISPQQSRKKELQCKKITLQKEVETIKLKNSKQDMKKMHLKCDNDLKVNKEEDSCKANKFSEKMNSSIHHQLDEIDKSTGLIYSESQKDKTHKTKENNIDFVKSNSSYNIQIQQLSSEENCMENKELRNSFRKRKRNHSKDIEINYENKICSEDIKSEKSCSIRKQHSLSFKNCRKHSKSYDNILNDKETKNSLQKKRKKNFLQSSTIDEEAEIYTINHENDKIHSVKLKDSCKTINEKIDDSIINTISEDINNDTMTLETEENNTNYLSPQNKKRLQQQAILNLMYNKSNENDDEKNIIESLKKSVDTSHSNKHVTITNSICKNNFSSNKSENSLQEIKICENVYNDESSLLSKENIYNESNKRDKVNHTDKFKNKSKHKQRTSTRNSESTISSHYKPYKLQKLIKDQNLLAMETKPVSFTCADISDDDEAFILNVPNKILQSNLQDQLLTLKERTIKFGQNEYITDKKISTTCCIFPTGKERKPYKIVNINISNVTVRERL